MNKIYIKHNHTLKNQRRTTLYTYAHSIYFAAEN